MNATATTPQTIEFEGYEYLELNGKFYKGCKRCGGTGHYSFNGYDSDCYLCNNSPYAKLGDELPSREAAEKWCHTRRLAYDARARKRQAEADARVAKMTTKQDALKNEAPEVYNFLMSIDDEKERSAFLIDMSHLLTWPAMCDRSFTPKMISAVLRIANDRNAKAAEAASHPAPEGRVVVTGEIVSARIVESDFGTSYKALVKSDDGFKVWVSIPSALMQEFFNNDYSDLIEDMKGRRLTFTATLEPSQDDISFAFGKRPTKGAWLA